MWVCALGSVVSALVLDVFSASLVILSRPGVCAVLTLLTAVAVAVAAVAAAAAVAGSGSSSSSSSMTRCCCLFFCIALRLFGEHVSYMLFACYLLSYEGSIHEGCRLSFFLMYLLGLSSEVC